jgi:hypothetical protein
MTGILIGLALMAPHAPAAKKDAVYEGTWVTTNRQLDGTMTCDVTDLGGGRWKGHFHGVWHGREFSYKVEFSGPPGRLKGRAKIDGASYEWTGSMTKGRLKGEFTGDRYLGSFNLKLKE